MLYANGKLYFTKRNTIICPIVCSICGIYTNFVNNQELYKITHGVKSYPICENCFGNGAEPILYGRSSLKHTKRERGQYYTNNASNPLQETSTTKKYKGTNIETNQNNDDKINIQKIITNKSEEKKKNTLTKYFDKKQFTTSSQVNSEPKKNEIITNFIDTALLNDNGKIINVAGDGNCGYHVLKQGLIDLNIDVTEFPTVQELRKKIFDHGLQNFESLQKKVSKYHRAVLKKSKERALSYWKNDVLSRIYSPSINLSEYADVTNWWHITETTGIVCDLFHINIVIYSLPRPMTQVFEYGIEEIKYKQVDDKNDFNIATHFATRENNTIYMVYTNENHFKYFKKNT